MTAQNRLRNERMNLELHLNSYQGIVMNAPTEEIPVLFAREILRVGYLNLRDWQRLLNHRHFEFDPIDFRKELEILEQWRERLSQVEGGEFVIEIQPADLITWYQIVSGMEIKDDEEEWFDFHEEVHPLEPIQDLNALRLQRRESIPTDEYIAEVKRQRDAQRSRVGGRGPCEWCLVEVGFTEPVSDHVHPGVRTATCLNCGRLVVHSIRTIREVVHPAEGRFR